MARISSHMLWLGLTADVFLEDSSVKHRLVGIGIISKEQAHDLGAVRIGEVFQSVDIINQTAGKIAALLNGFPP